MYFEEEETSLSVPYDEGTKKALISMGFSCDQSSKGSFCVYKLPENWKVRDNRKTDSGIITLLDEENYIRVNLWVKTAIWDTCCMISSILTKEEGKLATLEAEKEKEKKQEMEKRKRQEKEELLLLRSSTHSNKYQWGVFSKMDMIDFILVGHQIPRYKRCCVGYFETEEQAERMAKYISSNNSSQMHTFSTKPDPEELKIAQENWKYVDVFLCPDWYNKR